MSSGALQPTPSPWWDRSVHADRRPFLVGRSRLKTALRQWLDTEGFVETDVSALATSPGNEAHLHGFATEAIGHDGRAQPLYLHTSPEFACKKLLAAGEEQIYFFGPVWRNRERGPMHHPEFTMLEWYRVGAGYEQLMNDAAAMLQLAASTTGTKLFTFAGRHCDPFAAPERVSVFDAFTRHAGIDLSASIDAGGATDRDALAAAAADAGVRVASDDVWADIFSRILVERIEPNLGIGSPTILDRYPVAEAALARALPDDARVAERFELYCCGVELANGFGELTDPVVQQCRFAAEMDEKARVYGERYPIDEDFIAALAEMPPASGIALGFDRLAILATGATRIEQVLWAPVPEAG